MGGIMRLNREKVRRQMETAGIGEYQDLAQRIEVQPETMSRWFAGSLRPSWDKLSELCAVLDCTVNDLVDYPKVDARPSMMAPAVA
jgi:DNA-binding Xre family transcriptional regulator